LAEHGVSPTYIAPTNIPISVARFFLEHNTKTGKNVPNGHTISQISIKHFKWLEKISTFANLRPSKSFPNWDFGFENKPSGNPDPNSDVQKFFIMDFFQMSTQD
jgi:hypothetical protein